MPLNGYELLASGAGQRLERWGGRIVLRPETQATWNWPTGRAELPDWEGTYHGSTASGGRWEWRNPLPDPCLVHSGDLSFLIKPTASKHLGLFPEQEQNWEWIVSVLGAAGRLRTPPRVLNLFGYTGGSTLAAAAAGASVTHVDASKAMVSWCSENARLSGLGKAPIRYIVEDSLTFLKREIRRGSRYDAVVMDPPAFGRAKGGALWKLSEHLPTLIRNVHQVMVEEPLFLLLNIYSDSTGKLPENGIADSLVLSGGSTVEHPLGLTGVLDGKYLPCGITYRWKPE